MSIGGIGNGAEGAAGIGLKRLSMKNEGLPQAGEFGALLRSQLEHVVELHNQSEEMQQNFAAGKVEDMTDVVLSMQQADMALQLTLEMRNKVIEAYQEINRMQV